MIAVLDRESRVVCRTRRLLLTFQELAQVGK